MSSCIDETKFEFLHVREWCVYVCVFYYVRFTHLYNTNKENCKQILQLLQMYMCRCIAVVADVYIATCDSSFSAGHALGVT